jgi:arsenite methyltransferase
MGAIQLYESSVLRDVTGPVIRPGGFELTDRGLAHCRLAQGARVLDIGCGTGAVVDHLRQRHRLAALGIDRSAALLKEGSRTYRRSPLMRGQAEKLPSVDGCFAAALCECVLSVCVSPRKVLQEVRRVLQKGGYLVLTDVYARSPGSLWAGPNTVTSCLQGAVGRPTVERRIAAAGFAVLLWEDHTPLLRQLAARLVWAHGSLDAFWSAVVGPEAASMMNRAGPGGCGHPGYYLMVAQKP